MTKTEFAESTSSDLAWAAGLFAGEGYCGLVRRRGECRYLSLQVTMLDERCVERFGRIVGRPAYSWAYAVDRERRVFRVQAVGRTAEEILSKLWPFLKGTDKGDQIEAAARTLGVFGYINGTAKKPRLARDGGNQWRGRKHSEETKKKMSESAKRRWANA